MSCIAGKWVYFGAVGIFAVGIFTDWNFRRMEISPKIKKKSYSEYNKMNGNFLHIRGFLMRTHLLTQYGPEAARLIGLSTFPFFGQNSQITCCGRAWHPHKLPPRRPVTEPTTYNKAGYASDHLGVYHNNQRSLNLTYFAMNLHSSKQCSLFIK